MSSAWRALTRGEGVEYAEARFAGCWPMRLA